MATSLDRLLDRIHPKRTLDQVDARIDEAINTFDVRRGVIGRWEDFKDCLARFLIHLETRVLCLRAYPEISPEFSWGRCARLLLDEYGMNGDKYAFEAARTGNEGGLYAVLKAVARRTAQEYARNEISALINTFVNGLTVEEQLAASQEYLDKFGHLLPSELTEGSAARLHANFRRLLEEHPNLMRRLGRIGRY